jgi:prevent-host-death family protein
MRTATVRDVQHHLAEVLAWVEQGEEVQITRRSKPVARLIPEVSAASTPVALPDFAGRARRIWGVRPKGDSLSDTVLADRAERP